MQQQMSELSSRLKDAERSLGSMPGQFCYPPGLPASVPHDPSAFDALLERVDRLERVFVFVDFDALEAAAKIVLQNNAATNLGLSDVESLPDNSVLGELNTASATCS